MPLLRPAIFAIGLLLFALAALPHLPGAVDSQGMVLGAIELDPVLQGLDLVLGLALVTAALWSRGTARLGAVLAGLFLLADGIAQALTGAGLLAPAELRAAGAGLPLRLTLPGALPHLALGLAALLAAWLLDRD